MSVSQCQSSKQKAYLAGINTRLDAPLCASAPAHPVELIDLMPRIQHGYLYFDCPACCAVPGAHAIRVPFANAARVSFHDVSVIGLIDVGCWRGRVKRGLVVSC